MKYLQLNSSLSMIIMSIWEELTETTHSLVTIHTFVKKWTVKVVMHFIKEVVLNAFILYDKTYPNKMRFKNFKM